MVWKKRIRKAHAFSQSTDNIFFYGGDSNEYPQQMFLGWKQQKSSFNY